MVAEREEVKEGVGEREISFLFKQKLNKEFFFYVIFHLISFAVLTSSKYVWSVIMVSYSF